MNDRTSVNLEKKQVEQILALFEEIDDGRGLMAVEKFISLIFKDALDRINKGW